MRIERGYKNYLTLPTDDKDFQHEKGILYLPEIRLAPEGWIRVRIENTLPSYNNDLLRLSTEASSQSINFNGAGVNTIFITDPLMAGRYSRILYSTTSQGDFQFYEDSIYVEPHDTVTFELTY